MEADDGVVEQVKVTVLGLALADDQDLLRQTASGQRLDEADRGRAGRNEHLEHVGIGVGDALGVRRKVDGVQRHAVLADDLAAGRREALGEGNFRVMTRRVVADHGIAARFAEAAGPFGAEPPWNRDVLAHAHEIGAMRASVREMPR